MHIHTRVYPYETLNNLETDMRNFSSLIHKIKIKKIYKKLGKSG